MSTLLDRVSPWRDGDGRLFHGNEEIDAESLLDTLDNSRRREVIRALVDDYDGESTISTLAEHVAAIENGVDGPSELDTQERKRVYVVLYQCHIPTLEDKGLIDRDRGEIRATDRLAVAYDALDAVESTPGVVP